jgi:hypothetical protein
VRQFDVLGLLDRPTTAGLTENSSSVMATKAVCLISFSVGALTSPERPGISESITA